MDGAKSVTGRLAQSDPALLGRTDDALVSVVVKLDYDSTAAYAGGIEGLAATSPRVTGVELTGESTVERNYEAYTADIDAAFRSDVSAAVPSARLGKSLSRVYGGVAMQLPANQVGAVLALPNVAAVQVDELNEIQTDSSNEFIGSPTIWNQTGGQQLAGAGVIFGDLDSGVWPEHPSLADQGVLSPPPAKADATSRTCDFGDNPLTPATDPFVCQNKLIGGEAFLDTYNTIVGGEVYLTARDSNGHGTHTTTTAAGNVVASAPVFGVDRGPVSGVAPGAWVISYKVCGLLGCFASDSAAAVEQAILDGVDVINFSISGGENPYADAVELAFLDAYAAGITVAASAGNAGPGASTSDHLSSWVITVAASTQTRAFQSSLHLEGASGSLDLVGSSITAGVAAQTPVVMAENVPGYTGTKLCGTAFPAGSLTGQIVACERGGDIGNGPIGRVQKGFNATQGGAVGMILYNPVLQDTETDNHFLPTVHLAAPTEFLAFVAANPGGITASFTDAVEGTATGDVMAAFSSRGPGGRFIKPDITAPGVQILAGHTPTPDEVPGGPPGQLFQAIAGTSMSAPHIAGSAILVKALHPTWGPGAIKSALMTTAKTDVLKEDEVTPTDPFDDGAGRVDLTKAGAAPIVFDETAENHFALGGSELTAMDLNLPSINVPTMPGSVHVTRTATNVTNRNYDFNVSVEAPAGSSIKVVPDRGRIRPGQSQTFDIYISSAAPDGQYFGQINIKAKHAPMIHLPVAFFNQQGAVTLEQSCAPTTIKLTKLTSCTVTASNTSFGDAAVVATTSVTNGLKIVSATGATKNPSGSAATAGPTILDGQSDATPSLTPGPSPAGFLPLSLFGVAPDAIGDEQILNYNVPAFLFGGQTYTTIGVDSNGYAVLGGGTAEDNNCCNLTQIPDTARPNGILAPFWTDLDGNGAEGIYAGTLTDGVSTWIVIEWQVNVWGTTTNNPFQIWIGVNGVEDISFAYDPANLPDFSNSQPFLVGVENGSGTAGASLPDGVFPSEDLVVTTTPGEAGESYTYTVNIRGQRKGLQFVRTTMSADTVAGQTIVGTLIKVVKK